MDAGKRNRENLPAEPKVVSVVKTPGKAFSQSAGVALPVQEAATQEEIKTDTVGDIGAVVAIVHRNASEWPDFTIAAYGKPRTAPGEKSCPEVET